MSICEMKKYIKKSYKTIYGKPVDSLPDCQIIAIYNSLRKKDATKQPQIDETIYLYADGACRGNGKAENIGALAYTLSYKDLHKEYAVAVPNTTNNKMELMAVITGLKAIKPNTTHQIVVRTDSMYVVKGITEWISGWIKKNWKDVKNVDLWKALLQLTKTFTKPVIFEHIKGHAGIPKQERVDLLCNQAIDKYLGDID